MLVLSRRDGEQIVVGDDVIIKVLAIARGRVRVGIEAPRNIQVRRSEIPSQSRNITESLSRPERPLRIAQLAGTVH